MYPSNSDHNSMDKSDQETRDFMNVQSFSQLPFIRPAPKDKHLPLRLFGKEVGTPTDVDVQPSTPQDDDDEAATKDSTDHQMSSRKFECHYCCRNFPTSQALGGHQNAHKRERQQAKRAHLQSAMAHAHADAHVYGHLINYTRLGNAPPLPPMPMPMPMPYQHHSWSPRLYGGGAYQPTVQPINGSPLAMWRIPTAARDRPMHQHQHQQQVPMYGPEPPSEPALMAASQYRFGYESKPQIREHVSLDLHL